MRKLQGSVQELREVGKEMTPMLRLVLGNTATMVKLEGCIEDIGNGVNMLEVILTVLQHQQSLLQEQLNSTTNTDIPLSCTQQS